MNKMNEYIENIISVLDSIIFASDSDKLKWRKINPSTFIWDKEINSGRYRSTLQKINGPNREYYRFEIKEVENKKELLSIDTRNDDIVEERVRSLYNSVQNRAYQNDWERDNIIRELLST